MTLQWDASALPYRKFPYAASPAKYANLGEYGGKGLLVVNVASKCGLTKQYEALEKLYRDYRRSRRRSWSVFPPTNLKAQEPGTNEEIANFCTSNFGVDFPSTLKRSP